MKKISLIITIVICLVIPLISTAELLVYEGFDYSPGTLGGKTGGEGWTSQWWSSSYNVEQDSLTLPNLLFTPQGGSALGKGDMNRLYPGIDFSQDGVYYISYLCRRTGWSSASSGEWADVCLRTNDFAYLVAWGISSAENFQTSRLGSTRSISGAASDDVFFIVGKLITRAEGNDEVFMQVYSAEDNISTTEPSQWMISGGSGDVSQVSERFTINAGTASAYQVAFDEFRIGTEWSSVVAPPRAGRIVYLTPQDQSEVFLPLTFTWHAPTDIESPTYKLYFSDTYGEVDPNDMVPDIAPVTITDTEYSPSSLAINTDYYWRVDIIDGSEVIVGSIVSFSTLAPLFPVMPQDGATGVAKNAVLSWESELPLVGDYEVYMGSSPETLSYVGMSTGTSFAPQNLDWGQTYYWQVIFNDGIDIVEGSVWSFTVADTIQCDGTLIADIDGNCITDTTDLAIMALEWLNCTVINDYDCE